MTMVDLVREAETTFKRLLDDRTQVVLQTASRHFDGMFDDVQAAIEGLDWKVPGHTNEIWWLMQGLPVV